MKSGERETTERIETRNQEIIRMHGEKLFTWDYWKLMPSNKQRKGKNTKRVTHKNGESSWNQALKQKSHERDKQLGLLRLKGILDHS